MLILFTYPFIAMGISTLVFGLGLSDHCADVLSDRAANSFDKVLSRPRGIPNIVPSGSSVHCRCYSQ